MDKLTSIRVFLQVAKVGSFSAAAKQLGISKAMASKHIANLENRLNVRLLNRTTRNLNLTESGIAYRDRVQGIMDELEETESKVAKLSAEPSGTLRVMAPTSFGSFHLSKALASYQKKFPSVSIDMIFTARTPDFISEGLDLAIRVGMIKDTSQVARKLSQSRQVVCAAPEYLDKYGIPDTPADLLRHNCLIYSPRTPLGEWQFKENEKTFYLRVQGEIKANTGDALRVAAMEGCGLTQLPTYLVGRDIKAGRLIPVLEQYESSALPIYAVFLHRWYLSAKVRTFVDFLYELYQPIPYWEHWSDN